ncbi:MAG: cytochrome P450, partial [Cyanobacteria bacterium MAG STY1_bin_7]|nr:cytochrome P450 [Cyanobacteria bacterium MAG STY1_bin_7]
PEGSVIQVVLSPTSAGDDEDLAAFRPQRHLDGSFKQTLLPFGGGERVCLGKALAELEIRLMAVGLLQAVELQLQPDQGVCLGKALAELEIRLMAVGLLQAVELQLQPDQDLALQLIPSPTPKDGLLVQAAAR